MLRANRLLRARGFSRFSTPVGAGALVLGVNGLLEVFLCRDRSEVCRQLGQSFPGVEEKTDPLLASAHAQIEEYFSGRRTRFSVPLDLFSLSVFQLRVLETLALIPYGEAISYSALAKRLDPPTAARAVGTAMARNPLPLLLPCHRVIGKDGGLRGYSGGRGIATKAWLLDFEQRIKNSTP